MNAPVDVLAVMDCAAETLDREADGSAGLREARAAVAELIEASRAFANDDRHRYRPMMVRLHAALARVQGA